jgi:hypothetical protein
MSRNSARSQHSTRRRLLSMAAAGALAAAAADAPVARAGSPGGVSPSEYDPLVGTWLAVYQRTPGSKLWGIWTYHGDGTLVTTGSDHPTRTPSHGMWRNLGNNKYQSSVIGVNVDSSGNTTGFTTVDTDFVLDSSGDLQNNISRVTFYDANGNLTQEVVSKATAMRYAFGHRSDPTPQVLSTPQLP